MSSWVFLTLEYITRPIKLLLIVVQKIQIILSECIYMYMCTINWGHATFAATLQTNLVLQKKFNPDQSMYYIFLK